VTGDILDLGAVCILEDCVIDLAPVVDLLGVNKGDVGIDAEAAVPCRVENAEIFEHLLQFGEEGSRLVG